MLPRGQAGLSFSPRIVLSNLARVGGDRTEGTEQSQETRGGCWRGVPAERKKRKERKEKEEKEKEKGKGKNKGK
ncbi:hypothetical protein TIFTF001_041110 [Ficus carica]|uniref:Uncharacterized protein n=2 Tax=Ficus carica TaxID=3494 RepID=A0AA88CS35_FICCA|nr:hypothetical protein TIFTF001_041110 [Ficus carica]